MSFTLRAVSASPRLRGHLFIVIVLLSIPGASAHTDTYDPLVVELHGFLTAEGAITEAAPEPSVIPFPAATPAAPAEPLRFSLAAPVRFAPAAGVVVDLTVRAEQPVLTGEGLEVALEPGGAPARVALPPAMAPGTVVSVSVAVQGAASYAEGDRIELLVRPLAPALAEGTLSLLVGCDADEGADTCTASSTVALHEMRVPSLADLELQDSDITQFLLGSETFTPAGAGVLVNTFVVGHGAVLPPAAPGWSPTGTWVVLRGEESDDDARAHAFPDRARRVDAAHTFTVNDRVVRVHPGIGVVVPAPSEPVRIKCIAHCPPNGFFHTLSAAGAPTTPSERPSSLVPPPRDPRGIPVSADEPEEKGAPLGALVALAALALASRRKR